MPERSTREPFTHHEHPIAFGIESHSCIPICMTCNRDLTDAEIDEHQHLVFLELREKVARLVREVADRDASLRVARDDLLTQAASDYGLLWTLIEDAEARQRIETWLSNFAAWLASLDTEVPDATSG